MHSFLLPLRSVFLVSVDSSLLFRVDAVNGVESVIFSPADLRTKVILGGSVARRKIGQNLFWTGEMT